MVQVEDNSGNWRIGVLYSQTGVAAAIERTQLNGTLLAIEEINANGSGTLHRSGDVRSGLGSKKFRSFAERLFRVDRIRLLSACYMSSTRKAVLRVVEAHRGLLRRLRVSPRPNSGMIVGEITCIAAGGRVRP
jgi:branched-chain amino acid transport system substrate-binding protein